MLGRWVVMDLRVFPSIAEIGLIGVVHGEPAVEENSETLRGLVVVHVDLGDPAGKVVDEMVNRMIERNFDQRVVWKESRQLSPDRYVHAVVVIGMQESALLQVAPKHRQVLVAPMHVAVPGHIDVGDIPEIIVPQGDDLFLG